MNPRQFLVGLPFLAAMKMVAGRPKDALDLAFIVTHPALDLEATLQIVHSFLGAYAVKELRATIAEARWHKEAGLADDDDVVDDEST